MLFRGRGLNSALPYLRYKVITMLIVLVSKQMNLKASSNKFLQTEMQ